MKLSVGMACCAGLVALGCNVLNGPTPREVIVTTDKPTYQLSFLPSQHSRYQLQIGVRIQNVGTQQVNIGTACGNGDTPMFSVMMADGTESAFNPAWLACLPSSHPVLAPGETRVDTLTLSAPSTIEGGAVSGSLSGRMKLLMAVSGCSHDVQCTNGRISNDFDVQLPSN